jgi:hypothetical protein
MARYNNPLTTLEKVKQAMDITEDTDDEFLKRLIWAASNTVETTCDRVFVPYRAVLYEDIPTGIALDLSEDLLVLDALTVDEREIEPTEYVLLDKNRWPVYQIMPSGGYTTFLPNGWQLFQTIALDGVWGYNQSPATMFKPTSLTLTSAATDTDTVFDVSGLTGVETLMHIRVGEELMRVLSYETIVGTPDTYTITVERGVNGYEAVAHDVGAVIEFYQMDSAIEYATTHYTLYLYQTRDNFGEAVQLGDRAFTMSKTIPEWVYMMLGQKARTRFYTP